MHKHIENHLLIIDRKDGYRHVNKRCSILCGQPVCFFDTKIGWLNDTLIVILDGTVVKGDDSIPPLDWCEESDDVGDDIDVE